MQSAEDLVYEVCTALQEEPPADNTTLSPMVPEIFPNSVPHMRFQRITTVNPEVSLSDLALRGSLKRSARAVRAQCNYLGVWPYWRPML